MLTLRHRYGMVCRHFGAAWKFRSVPGVAWHYIRMAIFVDLLRMTALWCKMETWILARAAAARDGLEVDR